jgi:hypothetical protein
MALPVLVVIGHIGFEGGAELLGSVSAYYHTCSRDVFVGILSVVGLFLIMYQGPEAIDDRAGLLAGLCALGVATFPVAKPGHVGAPVGLLQLPGSTSQYVHLAFAATLFIILAAMAGFLFTRNSGQGRTPQKHWRDGIYRVCACAIVVSLLGILMHMAWFPNATIFGAPPVFVGEAVSLLAFGYSWLIKGETFFRDR